MVALSMTQSSGGFEIDGDERERESTVRRVCGMLKLAGTRSGGAKLSKRDRQVREIEHWKALFMKVDRSGEGLLGFDEVKRLARKHLNISERVCPDDHLRAFFSAIDADGGGALDFIEFMDFVNQKPSEAAHNMKIVELVRRCVKLALTRQKMTLAQLEYRFYHSAEEGIIDDVHGDGSLGPEEMRRFFRKVLAISDHEVPDRHLVVAFKSMDEDDGGTLDGEEFMDFIRDSIQQQSKLSPRPHRSKTVPDLVGGMRDVRQAHPLDSTVPFCCNGRDLHPASRFQMNTPKSRNSVKSCPVFGSARPCSRATTAGSMRMTLGLGSVESQAAARPATSSASIGQLPAMPQPQNHYRFKGAGALNRIEERLFASGIDVRGGYHRRS